MCLGNRLKKLRDENNFSQKDVANRLNISNATLSQYESAVRQPSYDILKKLADIYDVSIDYLLGCTNIRNFKDNNNLSVEELSLIDDYKKLNSTGKKEAEKRVKELTLIPFYVEEKVVSLAAHNDHLYDPDEKEKILEDFNDMDEW